MRLIHELNNDQLDGLAKLCFDLSKANFILAILPSVIITEDPSGGLIKMLIGLFWGIAFTYIALILLQYKKG